MRKLIMMVGLMPIMALAYETEVVDNVVWRYTIRDGKAQVGTGYANFPAIPKETIGAVTIPSNLGGCPVVAVLGNAFESCAGLTSVTIPEGVMSIGDLAFVACTGLKSVEIPEGVTSIGQSAFSGCSVLEAVTIPKSVTKVASHMFYNCKGLKSVIISEGVTCIEYHAFFGCINLMSMKIPEGVTSIGGYAFSHCNGLKSVTIPSTVSSIGECTFQDCNGIVEFSVSSDSRYYKFENGLLMTKDGKILVSNINNIDSQLIIPEGVTNIVKFAFWGQSRLISVTIPEGVASIGIQAFDNCTNLISVNIPSSVTSIGHYAFDRTQFYDNQPDGMIILGSILYEYKGTCPSSVVIPESVRTIGEYAFRECTELTSVTMPLNLKSIGRYAFYNCSKLTSAILPKGTISIGDCAFYGCRGLTSLTIPSSVTSIGVDAFCSCYVENLEVSRRWSAISFNSVTNLIVSDGTTNIGAREFYGCWELKSLTIPSSVMSIGKEAFYRCEELTAVTISEGVIEIGEYAFRDCTKLASVPIPPSVRSIGKSAFYYCSGLKAVYISDLSAWSKIKFGNEEANPLYYTHKLYLNKEELFELQIPEDVTNIGDYAFRACKGLTSLTISDSVTSIGRYAFAWCDGLTSIKIPESVTSIADNAFYGCNGLTEVVIPPSVTNCGASSFSCCRGLKSAMISDGVMSVGRYMFSDCNRLESVTIPPSVTSIGENAFNNCNGLITVYVDKGDGDRVNDLYSWPSKVKFVEILKPTIDDDPGATVTGDSTRGFVVKPSAERVVVEVTIPQGVDAAKVTVEVSPKVESVKPNGSRVKIVNGADDITEFLDVPAVDGNGVIGLKQATVKEEFIKEVMNVEKGAVFELNATSPKLRTSNTRKGLFYQLREGEVLGGMVDGDSTIGDGNPWTPNIGVKGGNSAFYSIGVRKCE